MRNISKTILFSIRFGTRFTKIALLITFAGLIISVISIPNNVSLLPTAVAFLMVGSALIAVSIIRANRIIKLIQTGELARGRFKECRNSFIIYNNSSLVFLTFAYHDNKNRKKEVSVLSPSREALDEVTIFYSDEESVVLEYLPGSPYINQLNEIC